MRTGFGFFLLALGVALPPLAHGNSPYRLLRKLQHAPKQENQKLEWKRYQALLAETAQVLRSWMRLYPPTDPRYEKTWQAIRDLIPARDLPTGFLIKPPFSLDGPLFSNAASDVGDVGTHAAVRPVDLWRQTMGDLQWLTNQANARVGMELEGPPTKKFRSHLASTEPATSSFDSYAGWYKYLSSVAPATKDEVKNPIPGFAFGASPFDQFPEVHKVEKLPRFDSFGTGQVEAQVQLANLDVGTLVPLSAKMGRELFGHHALFSPHFHLLGELNKSELRNKQWVHTMVDFWRRANIYAELWIVARGGQLSATHDRHGMVEFDYYWPEDLVFAITKLLTQGLTDAEFQQMFADKSPEEHARIRREMTGTPKMAAVGLRSFDVFGGDAAADWLPFSFEVRFLLPSDVSPEVAIFLRALQRAALSRDFTVPIDAVAYYTHKQVRRNNWAAVEEGKWLKPFQYLLHYRKPAAWFKAHPVAELADAVTPEVFDFIARHLHTNHALGMLLHDWREDLVLYDRPGRHERILTAQKQALYALAGMLRSGVKRERDVRFILQMFVKQSGLLDIFGPSIGMANPLLAQPVPIDRVPQKITR